MYLLDGLQLNKLIPPEDTNPCSIDPQWDVAPVTVVTHVLLVLIKLI
jgi:hypothetical protein